MKPKTYVSIILDRSGSMSYTKKQAVSAFNEQVQQMKENSKDQDIFCSLVTFNGDVFEHLWCEPADKLCESTDENYNPSGSTSLRDAIGYTVKKLTETVTPDENTAFLAIIISDGEENSSKYYNNSALKEMIKSCQDTGKWTFTYLGCSEECVKKVAKETSIPITNMAVWNNAAPELASKGLGHMNKRVKGYYSARVGGQNCVKNLCSDDGSITDFSQQDSVKCCVANVANVATSDVFGTCKKVEIKC